MIKISIFTNIIKLNKCKKNCKNKKNHELPSQEHMCCHVANQPGYYFL